MWLIRHAESVSNAGEATDDPATIPLTARGVEQAGQLAASIPCRPALIVTSGYIRTELTARPTIERFPDVPHEQWPVHEFTYLHGPRGRPMTGIERQPLMEEYWTRADPSYVDGPGAESFAGLLGRAHALLQRLRSCPEGPVAVFTHGMFIRAVLWTLLTEPAELAIAPTAEEMLLFRAFDAAFPIRNTAVVALRL